MKKIAFFLILFLLSSIQTKGQITKTTDYGVFSFTYPSNIVSSKAKMQEGFVMALESDKCFISASLTDLLIDGFSIWDDEFYNEIKGMKTQGVKLLKIEKLMTTTKSGKRKCIRTISDVNTEWKSFIVQYSFIHKTNLINVQFVFPNSPNQMSFIPYTEELIKGIRFK